MPKISIITTTYKNQEFIAQTIESILAQTYTDRELLIWDDSPDNETREVIQKYVKQYPDKIKAWHHSPNKWIVDNLNFLISQSSEDSKYIAFLEGDDIYTSDNLQKKMDVFSAYPDVKLVYNNLDFIDRDGNIFYKNFLRKAPFYIKNHTISKETFMKYESFYGSYSTLMIQKDVLKELPIRNITDDKVFGASDWDLFFRIATNHNTHWLSDSLTLYRRHPWNVSGQYIKLFNDLIKQIDEYRDTWFISEQLYKRKLAFIHLLKSVAYLEKNERKNSYNELFLSIKLRPFDNIIRKIGVLILNILPRKLVTMVLQKVIKR